MSSSQPKPVPTESEWPIYFNVSVVIEAPRERVWEELMDFGSYSQWNPFIRGASVTDASKNPLRDDQIAPGHKLIVHVHTPPTMDDSIKARALVETVFHVVPGQQLVWGASAAPRLLFGSQRWNVLSDVEGGTKFEIVAVLSGLGGALAMRFMRKAFVEGIGAMAEGLKARCEQRY
ncbi:hypothetical protein K438DRAFT_1625932 [Mycena galopus ATCC 62051]|nr:hypothetical protein K438DRAFT_1625932 [Mycena galopus ATCC 62051]